MSKRMWLVIIASLILLCLINALHGQNVTASKLFLVVKDGKTGFIDKTGKIVVEPKFFSAQEFSEGLSAVLARVNSGAGWGYIDSTGKIVIEPTERFVKAGSFFEGLAPVMLSDSKWGYIDRTGQFAVKAQFDMAYPFIDGLARVQDDGKYGYIDKTGRIVVELIYDNASDFNQGLASVTLGSKHGYIDKLGKYVWAPSK